LRLPKGRGGTKRVKKHRKDWHTEKWVQAQYVNGVQDPWEKSLIDGGEAQDRYDKKGKREKAGRGDRLHAGTLRRMRAIT